MKESMYKELLQETVLSHPQIIYLTAAFLSVLRLEFQIGVRTWMTKHVQRYEDA